jgi:hypothetical protein
MGQKLLEHNLYLVFYWLLAPGFWLLKIRIAR